ncbi:MAG: hypothetical protein J5I94_26695 [Phaeodactylibacter sp.]|nr:hypothetical protein [Phaeodactylibacter sp.]
MGPRKKLLIIYYNFPPAKVPGAVRLHHFYRAALPYFEDIHVLATRNRRLFQQDPSLETGCRNIVEAPAWDLRRLTARKKAGNKPFVAPALKERPLVRWLRRLVDSFPFNILIGDGGLVYIFTGYIRTRKLIEREGITHVFSTFRPYSDHLIAHLLKRRFPHLYWIADFRDLHVDPVLQNTICPPFQRWCNRQVLRRADLVTTVSEGLKGHLEKVAPRVEVLRNGIKNLDEVIKTVEPFEKFTIVYTGSLYEGMRDPGPIFCAIRRLVEKEYLPPAGISLLYAGPNPDCWLQSARKAGVGQIAASLGIISREEALQLQRRAQLNLLLSWSGPGLQGVLTGKLFEYLQARRPILALVNGSQDKELEDILSAWEANAVFYSNGTKQGKGLEKFLLHRYRIWEEREKEIPPLDSAHFEQYSWPYQMHKLINEL